LRKQTPKFEDGVGKLYYTRMNCCKGARNGEGEDPRDCAGRKPCGPLFGLGLFGVRSASKWWL
jgi:hypothetical protein